MANRRAPGAVKTITHGNRIFIAEVRMSPVRRTLSVSVMPVTPAIGDARIHDLRKVPRAVMRQIREFHAAALAAPVQ
ncbi:MAG: hypothetical protein WCF85_18480 [Rhodospirillaceae bacterium]